mmetsp:Transcript_29634/g.60655  ORF Transcript_29634/g.60655 Transcript_29634/m.60655 type:complete len:88 (+) Transcript_29634:882-1145(+)
MKSSAATWLVDGKDPSDDDEIVADVGRLMPSELKLEGHALNGIALEDVRNAVAPSWRCLDRNVSSRMGADLMVARFTTKKYFVRIML